MNALHLNVAGCEAPGGRTLHPPLDKVLSAESLHKSLKLCHYIVSSASVSPPSVEPEVVCQSLLLPRLLYSSSFLQQRGVKSPVIGKSDVALQELLVLSNAISAQWTDELDPFEKVVIWLKDLQVASGTAQVYQNRGSEEGTTSMSRVEYDDFCILMNRPPVSIAGEGSSPKKAASTGEPITRTTGGTTLSDSSSNNGDSDDAY